MRILLVEDEIGQYETFIDILSDINLDEEIKLSWTDSSQKAIQKLNQEDFDVAFIDINLRGSLLNGIELCKHLRHTYKLKIPIIIYSISRNPEDQKSALQAGADYFMIKPFRYNDFLSEVKALITNIHRQQQVA